MKNDDFEKRLFEHASRVKITMAAPFAPLREELNMSKKHPSFKKTALICAAVLCLLATTAFAAFHYLSAREVANTFGEPELAKLFEESGAAPQTITDGKYRMTLLGLTTGENLNHFESSDWEVIDERTYAVVAVEKADGTPMTPEDQVMVTPLISGEMPWACNIYTLAGGHTEQIIDGVLYRIIETNSLEAFAHRTVYMAVYEDFVPPSAEIFTMKEDGSIAFNEAYTGARALFEIPMDKMMLENPR